MGDDLRTNFDSNSGGGSNVADSVSAGLGVGGIGFGSGHSGDIPAGISNGRADDGKNKRYQSMQQQQYYYHHRSSDIITSGAVCIYIQISTYIFTCLSK